MTDVQGITKSVSAQVKSYENAINAAQAKMKNAEIAHKQASEAFAKSKAVAEDYANKLVAQIQSQMEKLKQDMGIQAPAALTMPSPVGPFDDDGDNGMPPGAPFTRGAGSAHRRRGAGSARRCTARRLFDRIDVDASGKITLKEVHDAYQSSKKKRQNEMSFLEFQRACVAPVRRPSKKRGSARNVKRS